MDQAIERLRLIRNGKLRSSDWTQAPDAPVDRAAWAAYRQALRDLPANTADPARLWAFIRKYYPDAAPEHEPMLDRLVHNACAYWRDWIAPERNFRPATPEEATAMRELVRLLHARRAEFDALPAGPEREAAIQNAVYDAGRREPFAVLTLFDASDRDACATRRTNTTSPLQALTALNEGILVEAQKGLGKRLLVEEGDDAAKIRAGFALIGDTQPPDAAVKAALSLLESSRRAYTADIELARKAGLTSEEAAWWQVATALLNSDAALNRN